jgi:hypothetical protein
MACHFIPTIIEESGEKSCSKVPKILMYTPQKVKPHLSNASLKRTSQANMPKTSCHLFGRTFKRQEPRFHSSGERANAKNHASPLQTNVQTPKTTIPLFRRTHKRHQPRFTLSDERTNTSNHASLFQTNVQTPETTHRPPDEGTRASFVLLVVGCSGRTGVRRQGCDGE